MNWAHIHLMFNHFPVVGSFVGLAILAYAMGKNNSDMKRFSLWYFMVLGAITMLVYFTGEPAEELIEHLPGVSESVIGTHEEAAEGAFIVLMCVSLLSLAGLALKRLRLTSRRAFWLALLLGVVATSGLMARAANLGGKIRHPEISPPTES